MGPSQWEAPVGDSQWEASVGIRGWEERKVGVFSLPTLSFGSGWISLNAALPRGSLTHTCSSHFFQKTTPPPLSSGLGDEGFPLLPAPVLYHPLLILLHTLNTFSKHTLQINYPFIKLFSINHWVGPLFSPETLPITYSFTLWQE